MSPTGECGVSHHAADGASQHGVAPVDAEDGQVDGPAFGDQGIHGITQQHVDLDREPRDGCGEAVRRCPSSPAVAAATNACPLDADRLGHHVDDPKTGATFGRHTGRPTPGRTSWTGRVLTATATTPRSPGLAAEWKPRR